MCLNKLGTNDATTILEIILYKGIVYAMLYLLFYLIILDHLFYGSFPLRCVGNFANKRTYIGGIHGRDKILRHTKMGETGNTSGIIFIHVV